ncbi:hypothetical protein DFP72DRAFT_507927 [Ephemerocybe angulata]|uniref:Uncharacterized protein n=1 Tax=Ephemerocybe angulata TaxID=980116 RepID=A0A8H6M0A2_9AGAR|nr:hypothetical protein DFP72DRAFT_507927 [Tulosesus angulatus]
MGPGDFTDFHGDWESKQNRCPETAVAFTLNSPIEAWMVPHYGHPAVITVTILQATSRGQTQTSGCGSLEYLLWIFISSQLGALREWDIFALKQRTLKTSNPDLLFTFVLHYSSVLKTSLRADFLREMVGVARRCAGGADGARIVACAVTVLGSISSLLCIGFPTSIRRQRCRRN